MAKRMYILTGKKDLRGISTRAIRVANVLDQELGTEPLSRKTLEGVVKLASQSLKYRHDYLDDQAILEELIKSEFLELA